MSHEEIDRDGLKRQHPRFVGDWEALARLTIAAQTPTRSHERQEAVGRWNQYNTTRKDWAVTATGMTVKTALTRKYRQVDLRGCSFQPLCLGYVDLRASDFRGSSLPYAMLKGALFYEADLCDVDLSEAFLERTDFTRATMKKTKLPGANLTDSVLAGADLREANLEGANLTRANLFDADLRGASLRGADLRGAGLVRTDLRGCDLTGCKVYGISAWDVKLDDDDKLQRDLIVSPEGTAEATVDRINVAQFYYLMLANENLRDVIRTIGRRGVLLLGRFTPERKRILDALRSALREHDYLPMMFDFEQPHDRPFTDTVITLAGLSRFVIADLTQPASVPHEIAQVTTSLTMPIAPILQKGEKAYSMFKDHFARHPERVLDVLEYDSLEQLIDALPRGLIERAETRCKHLETLAAKDLPTVDAGEFTDRS